MWGRARYNAAALRSARWKNQHRECTNGDKLRLLAVPHIFRRQRPLPIALIPRRSGGPSGSTRAPRYRPPPTPRRARAPGYRARDGTASTPRYRSRGLHATRTLTKHNVLNALSTREHPRVVGNSTHLLRDITHPLHIVVQHIAHHM